MATTAAINAITNALPANIGIEDCAITTVGTLNADYPDIQREDDYATFADDDVAVILPGWIADDGNAPLRYPLADNAAEAAKDYVDGGDWGDATSTTWVTVNTHREAIAYCAEDGEAVLCTFDSDTHTTTIDPDEPDCASGHDHDWQAPVSVVGGIEDNPGVWGHGGGVTIRKVCAHCGMYRIKDTWAQNPATGEQGLRSIAYEEADEASLAWIDDRAEG